VAIVLFCAGCADPRSIQVTPDEACPGQTVLLRAENAAFKDADAISVTIGDQSAPVVRIVDPQTVEVMIPKLSPGKARIRLEYAGKAAGEGTITIIPSPLRRLFLRMERDSVIVERTRPYNGEYDRDAAGGRRLSYDVISERGQLLYTGAIRHPAAGTIEVFGSPKDRSPRRIPAQEPFPFIIKIPYSPGRTVVKLYEVPDGVDLSTAEGRGARRLIREIEVEDSL
jgi:hypothetical protein